MKKLFIALLFVFIALGCSKSDENEPKPNPVMQAGFSYYRVFNNTSDTVSFRAVLSGQNPYVNIRLFPKEKHDFKVSTSLGFSEVVCYIPKLYCFVSTSKNYAYFDIIDRELTEIEIVNK